MTVRVALSGALAGVRRADVAFKAMPRKLRLSVGAGAPALEGELEQGVAEDGCCWQFEDAPDGTRLLVLSLEKQRGQGSWEHLLDSDVVQVDAAVTREVFLDVAIDGMPSGRVTLGLFGDVAPRTVENFRALCAGDAGSTAAGVPLHFKGCAFHRIIPGFMVQCGDFERGDGTGGASIYGERFEDESFALQHSAPFLLSMANAGPNTNGSQFFITTTATPHLDGKHVVFGRVLSGFDVIKRVESCGSGSGAPEADVRVADCGVLK